MDTEAFAGQVWMVRDGLRRSVWQGSVLDLPSWQGQARVAFDGAREAARAQNLAALRAVEQLQEALGVLLARLADATAGAPGSGAPGLPGWGF